MENLSKESLLAIKGIVKEIVDESIKSEIDGLRREMDDKFDLVRQEIRATKVELQRDIAVVRSEAVDTEGSIMGAISDIHDSFIKPRFENHEERILKLEQARA